MTDVPELLQGTLSPKEIQDLATDLQSIAELQSVIVKRGAESRAKPDEVPLQEALDELQAGTVTGVQIRYAFQDRDWCDTLIREGEAIRVIRMDVTAPDR
jgi:hypothetical protein